MLGKARAVGHQRPCEKPYIARSTYCLESRRKIVRDGTKSGDSERKNFGFDWMRQMRCKAVREGERKKYRITGTGSYLPLLTDSDCTVVNGVPNGIFQKREPGHLLLDRGSSYRR